MAATVGTSGLAACLRNMAPTNADCAPLRIIGHCAPTPFRRLMPVASCSRPDRLAQTPNTPSTAHMLVDRATATAAVVTPLATALRAWLGLQFSPPLRCASTTLATASQAG